MLLVVYTHGCRDCTSCVQQFTDVCGTRHHSTCCIHTSDIARQQHLQSAGCFQLFVSRHQRSMFGHRAFSVAGCLELITRLSSRSNTFFWQFSLWSENFSFPVLLFIDVCSGGAIWWMLARYRPTWSDVGKRLGAICFWLPIPFGLNLVVAVLHDSLYVVSLLPCMLYVVYCVNVCKQRLLLLLLLS